jgi:hypothetical protein
MSILLKDKKTGALITQVKSDGSKGISKISHTLFKDNQIWINKMGIKLSESLNSNLEAIIFYSSKEEDFFIQISEKKLGEIKEVISDYDTIDVFHKYVDDIIRPRKTKRYWCRHVILKIKTGIYDLEEVEIDKIGEIYPIPSRNLRLKEPIKMPKEVMKELGIMYKIIINKQ